MEELSRLNIWISFCLDRVSKRIDISVDVQLTVIIMPFPALECRQYSHAARVRNVALDR